MAGRTCKAGARHLLRALRTVALTRPGREPAGRSGVEDELLVLVIDVDDVEPAEGVRAQQALEPGLPVAPGQLQRVERRGRDVDPADPPVLDPHRPGRRPPADAGHLDLVPGGR